MASVTNCTKCGGVFPATGEAARGDPGRICCDCRTSDPGATKEHDEAKKALWKYRVATSVGEIGDDRRRLCSALGTAIEVFEHEYGDAQAVVTLDEIGRILKG